MKAQNIYAYTKVISEVLDNSSKNGEDLNQDFETIKQAMTDNKVDQLSSEELTKIKNHFQAGTDLYQGYLNQLQQVAVPVKLLGRHKLLVRSYTEYANACQSMTDSIDADNQTVNSDQFLQAEATQESSIEKVFHTTNRIMTGI